jgi:hypothetical protein
MQARQNALHRNHHRMLDDLAMGSIAADIAASASCSVEVLRSTSKATIRPAIEAAAA